MRSKQLDRLIGTLILNFQYSKAVLSTFLWSITLLIVVTECLTNTMWEGRYSPGKQPTVAGAQTVNQIRQEVGADDRI